jgi:SAM-dependent methyltransferase
VAKQGELDYLKNLGDEGRIHAFNKPFSDPNCGFHLKDMGTIISLLPPPPARLLDLGCGSGWTSCFFALRGYDVVAQDIADDMIALVNENKKRYGVTNVQAITSDYESLNFHNEFDCAVFYDSLHHAEDEKAALQAVYRALKPDAFLVTAEPGTGHTQTPATKRAKSMYGVTEKDMPPRLIVDLSMQVGFRKFQLYARHFGPVEVVPFLSLAGLRKLIGKLAREHYYSRAMGQSNFVVLWK